MGLNPDQFLYLLFAMLLAGTVTLWVLIDHFNQRVRSRAEVEQARAIEESRREIAAYVAEGSISAEDAAKILAAGGGAFSGIKSTIRECIDASAGFAAAVGGRSAR
jgi:hypothetical protein